MWRNSLRMKAKKGGGLWRNSLRMKAKEMGEMGELAVLRSF